MFKVPESVFIYFRSVQETKTAPYNQLPKIHTYDMTFGKNVNSDNMYRFLSSVVKTEKGKLFTISAKMGYQIRGHNLSTIAVPVIMILTKSKQLNMVNQSSDTS